MIGQKLFSALRRNPTNVMSRRRMGGGHHHEELPGSYVPDSCNSALDKWFKKNLPYKHQASMFVIGFYGSLFSAIYLIQSVRGKSSKPKAAPVVAGH